MAEPVKNIEREFLLAAAIRERSALTMSVGGGDWSARLLSVGPAGLTLQHEAPLSLLGKGTLCGFTYLVRGQSIAFKAAVLEPGEKRLVVAMPDRVYKNLARRYARLPPPGDLSASFSFAGERYDLDFPTSDAYRAPGEPEPSPDFDPADLKGLMAEFERKALSVGSERSLVMFKDRKPETAEEALTASTGRCFYLPSPLTGIPATDPFADRTILTRDDFMRQFIDRGLEAAQAERELAALERAKRSSGLLSELIVPILFQDYAIGCARVANARQGRPPFDLGVVETFVAFARVFSWSLKLHGYFKDAPRLEADYRPQVVDVSAGGLLFACGDARLGRALKEGGEVSVRLTVGKRSIASAGTIRRHYAGAGEAYFGIQFHLMAPEDFRFFFEYLYGRPFTDGDADSVEGIRAAST